MRFLLHLICKDMFHYILSAQLILITSISKTRFFVAFFWISLGHTLFRIYGICIVHQKIFAKDSQGQVLEMLMHKKKVFNLDNFVYSSELASSLKAMTLRLTVRHILLAANPCLLLETRFWTGARTQKRSHTWSSPQKGFSSKRCCYSLGLGLTHVTKLLSYTFILSKYFHPWKKTALWLIMLLLMMLTRICCVFVLIHFKESV